MGVRDRGLGIRGWGLRCIMHTLSNLDSDPIPQLLVSIPYSPTPNPQPLTPTP